jgi:succinyl-CoA synthetase alpha subunit
MTEIVQIVEPSAKAWDMVRSAIDGEKHVVVSSNRLSLEEEAELKERAFERDVLFMGPGCKTSIVNGKGFGIWNSVKRGPIGIVSTSGSGLREVSCLVDPVGVSHVLHVGSRDLSQKVDAWGTLGALKFLVRDKKTKVIILAAPSPVTAVKKRVLDSLEGVKKPCIVCFLGQPSEELSRPLIGAANLEDAANEAMRVLGKKGVAVPSAQKISETAKSESRRFGYGQRHVRGVFVGTMLCIEAQLVLSEFIKTIHSNVPLNPSLRLPDPRSSRGHACVDVGMPELSGWKDPVTELSMVIERISREARDWEVAVLLLDVMLGHGAHPNPAKELSKAIREAKRIVGQSGGHLSVVASIVGTERDPQNTKLQRKSLEEAGVLITLSNAQAARLAALISTKGKRSG